MHSRNGPNPPAAQPTADELLNFFNQSPDLLCSAGFDGTFKRLNPAWSPLLGWTNEELQARPFLDFVHPDDHPATLAVMDQLDAGATTISFENRYRYKDGSWKWLRWTASPLQGRQEIYASARDVTRRKQLELQILAASEHEQQRISRDLHDSLGPHLAAIRYAATFLADELRQRDPPAVAKPIRSARWRAKPSPLPAISPAGSSPCNSTALVWHWRWRNSPTPPPAKPTWPFPLPKPATPGPPTRRMPSAPFPDCPRGIEQRRETQRRP